MSGARELIEYIESHAREKVNETLPQFRFELVTENGDLKGFIWYMILVFFCCVSTVNETFNSFCDDFWIVSIAIIRPQVGTNLL